MGRLSLGAGGKGTRGPGSLRPGSRERNAGETERGRTPAGSGERTDTSRVRGHQQQGPPGGGRTPAGSGERTDTSGFGDGPHQQHRKRSYSSRVGVVSRVFVVRGGDSVVNRSVDPHRAGKCDSMAQAALICSELRQESLRLSLLGDVYLLGHIMGAWGGTFNISWGGREGDAGSGDGRTPSGERTDSTSGFGEYRGRGRTPAPQEIFHRESRVFVVRGGGSVVNRSDPGQINATRWPPRLP